MGLLIYRPTNMNYRGAAPVARGQSAAMLSASGSQVGDTDPTQGPTEAKWLASQKCKQMQTKFTKQQASLATC